MIVRIFLVFLLHRRVGLASSQQTESHDECAEPCHYDDLMEPSMNQTENPGDEERLLLNSFKFADTKLGRVKGAKTVSRNGVTYYQFKGIPYALPPVGNRRFEPPVPHGGWSGVRDSTKFKSQCLQVSIVSGLIVGKEDCLYLNVYTRKAYTKDELTSTTDLRLHPVIVFIHGGLFMFGGSNPFRGKYFLDQDVVLVVMNYRLASFGFLNTGNWLIPGNMGLKDQTLALKWVRDNIKYFNGDPNRVVLLGESAGAVSAHLHTLSPMSRGLFSGAISQSGTALSPWGMVQEPAAQSKEFASGLGCPIHNSFEMVQCLKSLPGRKIAKYHHGYIKALADRKQSLFGPTIESRHNGPSFLPTSPLKLLKSGKISRTPWITGVNSGEGLVQIIAIMRNEKLRNALNSQWDHFAPDLLNYRNYRKRSQLSTKVKEFYLQNKPLDQNNIADVAAMLSDRNFFLDNHDAAILQSRVAPTYVYHYSYEGRFSMGNLLLTKASLPLGNDFNYMAGLGISWVGTVLGVSRKNEFGVCHGDEVPLLFNMPLIRKEVTKQDRDYDISRKLIKLWVTFAESGVPETRRAWESVQWEAVRETNPDFGDIPLKYLNIDREFTTTYEPFHDGIQFWKNHSISYL